MFTATFVVIFAVAGQAVADSHPPVPAPGKAFIAPLATEAMLLDAVAIGERIYAVGEHGIVLRSNDAGQSWEQQQSNTRATLTGVYFVDEDTGWAVGHDAVIIRTRDGGQTWDEVYADPDDQRPLFDVWFADPDYGLAVGAYGLLMRTEDGGESWEAGELIPSKWPVLEAAIDDETDEFDFDDDEFYDFHLNHIVASPNGDLYVAAEAGHFFRSGDNGLNWFSMPTTYEGSFFSTLPLGDEQLLLMGLRGNLFHSNDGGQNWRSVDLPITTLLNDGLKMPGGPILIGGMAGVLLESSDGGQSFSLHQQADRKAISILLAAGSDQVVVVGEGGVYRSSLEALRQGGQQ